MTIWKVTTRAYRPDEPIFDGQSGEVVGLTVRATGEAEAIETAHEFGVPDFVELEGMGADPMTPEQLVALYRPLIVTLRRGQPRALRALDGDPLDPCQPDPRRCAARRIPMWLPGRSLSWS